MCDRWDSLAVPAIATPNISGSLPSLGLGGNTIRIDGIGLAVPVNYIDLKSFLKAYPLASLLTAKSISVMSDHWLKGIQQIKTSIYCYNVDDHRPNIQQSAYGTETRNSGASPYEQWERHLVSKRTRAFCRFVAKNTLRADGRQDFDGRRYRDSTGEYRTLTKHVSCHCEIRNTSGLDQAQFQ